MVATRAAEMSCLAIARLHRKGMWHALAHLVFYNLAWSWQDHVRHVESLHIAEALSGVSPLDHRSFGMLDMTDVSLHGLPARSLPA